MANQYFGKVDNGHFLVNHPQRIAAMGVELMQELDEVLWRTEDLYNKPETHAMFAHLGDLAEAWHATVGSNNQ